MCVCNIAGGFCRSYGSQFVTRALVAIFGCPPVGFGSAVVTELFFAHERAQKIGWWTLLLILGVPLGPLVMGFVVQRVGIDWIFWILACANGAQLVAYLSFKDETLYDRNAKWTAPQSTRSWVPRLNAAPLTWKDFARPLYFFARFKVLVPAVSYAMVFAYANTAIIVELPSIYVELYGFDTAKVGLQYVSVLIGAGIGEQISGPFSDIFLRWLRTQAGPRYPEQRLWLSYPAFMAVVAGIIVWGVQLDKAQEAQEVGHRSPSQSKRADDI